MLKISDFLDKQRSFIPIHTTFFFMGNQNCPNELKFVSFRKIRNQTDAEFQISILTNKFFLFLKEIWSVTCTMDSSFFSQQISYCLATLLVYMALWGRVSTIKVFTKRRYIGLGLEEFYKVGYAPVNNPPYPLFILRGLRAISWAKDLYILYIFNNVCMYYENCCRQWHFKGPYEKLVSPKIATKLFLDFCREIFCSFLGASWKLLSCFL